MAQLKNLGDDENWQAFHELYSRLIVGVAIKAGLRQEEAEDVLQETMASVSKHIQEFEANPARGKFRAWLLNMARWRIQDQLRRRPVAAAGNAAPPDATATTPTVERVPDPREVDLEGLCHNERQARGPPGLHTRGRLRHYHFTGKDASATTAGRKVRRAKATYSISCPSGAWPGRRKVLINSPSPQRTKLGNLLNHLPASTSGSVSSQRANRTIWSAEMFR